MTEPSMPTGYTLRLRADQTWHNAAILRPDVLGDLSPGQVSEKLGTAFDITGTQGQTLTLIGLPPLDGIGAHMTRGTLIVQGPVGDDLGASMTGGTLRVQGNAGDRVGGPALEQYEDVLPSDAANTNTKTAGNKKPAKEGHARRGNNGGTIIIHGSAGDYPALRMRRGLIVITGHAGKSPGYRMIAGTIVIAKGDLQMPGLEMQRGTIVSLSPDAQMHTQSRFAIDGEFAASSLSVVGLLLTQLSKLGLDITPAMRQGQWRLASGDRLELGKGELWQWIH